MIFTIIISGIDILTRKLVTVIYGNIVILYGMTAFYRVIAIILTKI